MKKPGDTEMKKPIQSGRVGDHDLFREPDDPPVPFDYYFTWEGYPNLEFDWDLARYVWQGKAVGQGPEGVAKILQHLEAIPVGSRVLVYPHYGSEYAQSANPTWVWNHPFLPDHIFEFDDVVVRRKLLIIWSCLDHNGDLHPWYVHLKRTAEGQRGYDTRRTK